MNRKVILAVALLALVASVFNVSFNTSIEAAGTIYITEAGTVDPPTAPIQREGNLYTFEGDVYESIVVEKDNIIIDGNGRMIKGYGKGFGLGLSGRKNVTVKNARIESFEDGIDLSYSSNSVLIGNTISDIPFVEIDLYESVNSTVTGNRLVSGKDVDYETGIEFDLSTNSTINGNFVFNASIGIWGVGSRNIITGNHLIGCIVGIYCGGDNNTVTRNVLTGNEESICLSGVDNIAFGNDITNSGGIYLESCHEGDVHSNTIVNGNSYGIRVDDSYNNTIYYNNFINNAIQVEGDTISDNIWYNKNPLGGNYWSDGNVVETYPLMSPWIPIEGDINLDGVVNIIDLAKAARNFGKTS